MIHDLKPYCDYQDSQSLHLGKVPSHWQVRSMGSLTTPRSDRNRGDLPLLSVVREKGVILRSRTGDDDNHNFIPDDLSNYKAVHKDDLVINKMKAWQGSLGIAPQDGIVSPAYYVFDFLHPEKRFAHFLLRSKPYVALFGQESDGVRVGQWDLSIHGMKRIPVLIPPTEECTAIVRFLDHADRRIRRAIRAKRKLIALLNEQKQVIIHQAVTRGLDPNVRLQPSGVAWLGDIPEHWEVWKIGHFARVGNGSTPSRGNQEYWSGGTYPWLNSACVNQSPVVASSQHVTALALKECHLPRVPVGSVLVAITGQGKTRGTSAVLNIEATINQHMAYITPRTSVISAEYLQLALIASYPELRRISEDAGSTKGALTCRDVSDFRVALPSPEEQQRLTAYIQAATLEAEQAIALTSQEIGLLLELRARLISDVVTGKLDVREAVAQLPADEPATESADDTEAILEDDDAPEDAEPEEVEA